MQIKNLHIIGGGCQNYLLNQYTANSVGIPVYAGPVEATSIGNIIVQAKAAGLVSDLTEMRTIVANSIGVKTYLPKDTTDWENAYKKYLEIIQ